MNFGLFRYKKKLGGVHWVLHWEGVPYNRPVYNNDLDFRTCWVLFGAKICFLSKIQHKDDKN